MRQLECVRSSQLADVSAVMVMPAPLLFSSLHSPNRTGFHTAWRFHRPANLQHFAFSSTSTSSSSLGGVVQAAVTPPGYRVVSLRAPLQIGGRYTEDGEFLGAYAWFEGPSRDPQPAALERTIGVLKPTTHSPLCCSGPSTRACTHCFHPTSTHSPPSPSFHRARV
jgi:hypothetical protein